MGAGQAGGKLIEAGPLQEGLSGVVSIDLSRLRVETDRELRTRMSDAFRREIEELMKTRNYHVAWDLDTAQWIVTEEGDDTPIAEADTQAEAVQYAVKLTAGEGQIKVHELDGTFSDASR